MASTLTIAGRDYEHVTDLHALATGDRLRQHHENHSVDHLTVLEPYGRHSDRTGVLVHVDRNDGWDSVLTDLSATYSPVWREIR
jgi:hypothetical protein